MLDKDSLNDLLRALHANRDEASHQYQALRERLIRFFQWNQTDTPEELADETLDRLARKLHQPAEQIQDPVRYAVGIAKLLLQEQRRKSIRRQKALAELQQQSLEADRREQDRTLQRERADLLQQCLQSIPPQSRELIFRYYDAEQSAEHRQQMARSYGISLNALRNRALRIRADLERQLTHRLQKSSVRAR
jgi:DNA-directed RNA polymerase specialized sigma24 family protein